MYCCYVKIIIIAFFLTLLLLVKIKPKQNKVRVVKHHVPAAYRVIAVNEHLPIGTIGIISNVIIKNDVVYGYFRPTRFIEYPVSDFSHKLLQINGSCVKIEMICVELVSKNVAIWSENHADV